MWTCFLKSYGIKRPDSQLALLPNRTRRNELSRRSLLMFFLGIIHCLWIVVGVQYGIALSPFYYWISMGLHSAPCEIPLAIVAYWAARDFGGDMRNGSIDQLKLTGQPFQAIVDSYLRRCLRPYLWFVVTLNALIWGIYFAWIFPSPDPQEPSLIPYLLPEFPLDAFLHEIGWALAFGLLGATGAMALAKRVKNPLIVAAALALALIAFVPSIQLTPETKFSPAVWEIGHFAISGQTDSHLAISLFCLAVAAAAAFGAWLGRRVAARG